MSKVLALGEAQVAGGQAITRRAGPAAAAPFGVVGQLIEFLIAGGGIGKT